jgi:hypothetical protein
MVGTQVAQAGANSEVVVAVITDRDTLALWQEALTIAPDALGGIGIDGAVALDDERISVWIRIPARHYSYLEAAVGRDLIGKALEAEINLAATDSLAAAATPLPEAAVEVDAMIDFGTPVPVIAPDDEDIPF